MSSYFNRNYVQRVRPKMLISKPQCFLVCLASGNMAGMLKNLPKHARKQYFLLKKSSKMARKLRHLAAIINVPSY